MEILGLFVAGLVSIGCYELLKWVDRRHRMPYRYTCPEPNCHLKASSTSKEGINLIKTTHTHYH